MGSRRCLRRPRARVRRARPRTRERVWRRTPGLARQRASDELPAGAAASIAANSRASAAAGPATNAGASLAANAAASDTSPSVPGAGVRWRVLGAAVREMELLADLAREAHVGRLRVPLDELERAGVEVKLAQPPWPELSW